MESKESNKINSFRDLRVWQLGMDLVEMVYQLSQDFPKSEIYGLASQMRRAAVSVPSNIAEGQTREHIKEYLQHISIAQGSLAELQTQSEIAVRLHYIAHEELVKLLETSSLLARQLYSLRNALAEKAEALRSGSPTPNTQHPTPIRGQT